MEKVNIDLNMWDLLKCWGFFTHTELDEWKNYSISEVIKQTTLLFTAPSQCVWIPKHLFLLFMCEVAPIWEVPFHKNDKIFYCSGLSHTVKDKVRWSQLLTRLGSWSVCLGSRHNLSIFIWWCPNATEISVKYHTSPVELCNNISGFLWVTQKLLHNKGAIGWQIANFTSCFPPSGPDTGIKCVILEIFYVLSMCLHSLMKETCQMYSLLLSGNSD